MLEISGEVLALLLMPIQTMGMLLASFLAYFIPIWTRLHWTAFGLGLVWTLPFAGFISESPRWLIAKKKYDKARSIVKYAAKRNKRELKMQTLHLTKKLRVREAEFFFQKCLSIKVLSLNRPRPTFGIASTDLTFLLPEPA